MFCRLRANAGPALIADSPIARMATIAAIAALMA
jgi:hypothetical protein